MKIISNYLGREQRESWREEKNGKVNAKQEMGNESKGKERVCSPLRAVAVLPECDDICGRRGGAGGKFRGQGKRLRQKRNQFMKAYFLGARSVLL